MVNWCCIVEYCDRWDVGKSVLVSALTEVISQTMCITCDCWGMKLTAALCNCSNWGTSRVIQSVAAGAQSRWPHSYWSITAGVVSDWTVSVNVSWSHQWHTTAACETQVPSRCPSAASEVRRGSTAHDRVAGCVVGESQAGEVACRGCSGVDAKTAQCIVRGLFSECQSNV